ncbi:MAG: T9SS type A sorting domain-containing protein [Chitinophagales bacterium]|jgi:hypothetical protein|nr:T9SS type A sorting domain-containing protein [Sphingobacteriales bacterium]MCC7056454.1 T9SS type A sorting domain-containing protein [Chitinophagales bacterium]MDA0198698.1 T9SS type A sorting domain-containing protein [Bacteroidota bacterium]
MNQALPKVKSLATILLVLFFAATTTYAENPPYAKIVSGPNLVGSNYEFLFRLDPNDMPDCGGFNYDCNVNGFGIDNVDIHWFLYANSDCSACDLQGIEVQNGLIAHGFWGTNCTVGSTAVGSSCASPGGCDNLLQIPASQLCIGTTYTLFAYAMNPDYDKGVADNSNVGPGPWRCCNGNPSIGNLDGMEDCTLPDGSGWLNPSYPQTLNFTITGQPTAPNFSVATNLNNNQTITCGFTLNTTLTTSPTNGCIESSLVYQIKLNGVVVATATSNCTDGSEILTINKELIACPGNPGCIPNANQLKVNCGANTIRWEAYQTCTSAAIASQDYAFVVGCPEADKLTVTTTDQILCAGESGTVQVENPANIVIPYAGGSYHIHWNNANPYNNPNLNHLGAGTSFTLTNNGTYPYNTLMTFTGTIWEDFSDSAPPGCEEFAGGNATMVMLAPIEAVTNEQACSYNSIDISANGGLPDYDSSPYTFDATSAGLGTNNTGQFSGFVPQGTYPVIITDQAGCQTTIDVEIFNPINVNVNTITCSTFNTFTLQVSGGQPAHPNYNNLALYEVSSNIDGFLGNCNTSGLFTATGLSSGNHTITVSYEYIDPYGVATGIMCSQTVTIEVYDPFSITLSTDPCDFQEKVKITGVNGGRSPLETQGGGFPGAIYTIFLSTTPAPGAVNDVSSTPATLSGPGTFLNVAAGNYYVVLQDDRGCQYSVPVTVTENNETYTISQIPTGCTWNKATIQTTGGQPGSWVYYLYNLGAPFDDGATDITTPVTPNTISPGVYQGSFTGISGGQYTVYAENSTGCTVISMTVGIYNPLNLTEINQCVDGQIYTTGSGGYAGASWNSTSFTYKLFQGGTLLATNNTGIFTGLSVGTYTVEVNDNNPDVPGGCTKTLNVQVYTPMSITANGSGACTGGNTVTVNTVAGGKSPYVIYLSTIPAPGGIPNVSSTPATLTGPGTFSNVASGSYHVILSDARGCQVSVPVTLTGQAPVISTPALTCTNPPNNTAIVNVTNGAPDWDFYLYTNTGSFDPLNPENAGNGWLATDIGTGGNDYTGNFTGIAPGTYKVWGLDANNCQVGPQTVKVRGPLVITASASGNCGQGGTVTINSVSGGSDPNVFAGASYTIFLSTFPAPGGIQNVSTTPPTLSGPGTFTNVPNGNYYAILQDNLGCQASVPVIVTGNPGTLTATQANCNTPPNTAQATATGGTPDWDFYLYQFTGSFDPLNPTNPVNGWVASDLGVGGNDYTGNFMGINPGTYKIWAIDNSGCVAGPVTVTVSAALVITGSYNCQNNLVTVNNVDGGHDPDIFSGAGLYDIFLSTLPAPGAIPNVSSTPPVLHGPGTFSGVASGNYYLVVEDDLGCQASIPIAVNQNQPITLLPFDNCKSNQFSVQASGPGWTFYLYTSTGTFVPSDPQNAGNGWLQTQNGDANGKATFTNVSTGSYVVYSLNNSGCPGQPLTVNIVAYPELVVTNNTTLCDYGILNIGATGGSTPYLFKLFKNGILVAQNNNGYFSGLNTGTYSVTVTDALGCTKTLNNLVVTVAIPLDIVEPYSCADGIVAIGGVAPYIYELYTPGFNPTLIETNTDGKFDVPPGMYLLVVTDANGCSVSQIINCEDIPECDLEVSATVDCLNDNEYTVTLIISGIGEYTIQYNTTTLTNKPAGTYTFTLPNGSYDISITSEDIPNCVQVIPVTEDCLETCDLTVAATTECIDTETFGAFITITGQGLYNITDGIHAPYTNATAGTYTFGPYDNGNYNVVVTKTDDATCTETVTVADDCTVECDLAATVSTSCFSGGQFVASVTITGSGTYNLDDGVNILYNIDAGTYNLGLFDQGNYTITVTSTADPTCVTILPMNVICCDLEATIATDCTDDGLYNVVLTITGSGTYKVVHNGQTDTGLDAGTYEYTGYDDEDAPVTFVVTSETDASCKQTLTAEANCFDCVLNASAATFCIDNYTFETEITISGEGLYTISEGSTVYHSGVGAGVWEVGPLTNGMHNISVVSGSNPDCTTVVPINENCYQCNLSVSQNINCTNGLEFTITLTIVGPGTYTVDDGIHTPQTGKKGTVVVGPFPNGNYTITITNEETSDCFEVLTGTQDCFECDLTASATTECQDDDFYFVDLIISGTGTFTVTNFNTPAFTGLAPGTYTFGPYANDETYEFGVISEEDPNCQTVVEGTETCFDCQLPTVADVDCVSDKSGYMVTFVLEGTATYTIYDGINAPQTFSAGPVTLGPYSNGTYSITIINNADPDCFTTLNGAADCYLCDLTASTNIICNDDNTNYNITLNVGGTGVYNVTTNFGVTLTNITAGTYTLGPVPNGSYLVNVASPVEANCRVSLAGVKDCTPEFNCDVQATANTICEGQESYNLEVILSGTDTYVMTDGVNPPLTGLTAGTYSLGPIANGNYNLTIISEANPECFTSLGGFYDCEDPIICDPVATALPTCLTLTTYEVTVTLAGTGTFTLTDGINTPITNATAGAYVLGPLTNGAYSIVITNEADPNCQVVLNGTKTCNYDCVLNVVALPDCLPNQTYMVKLTIEGNSTYTITDGIHSPLIGVSAGSTTIGPFENAQIFNITVSNENNPFCFQTVSGLKSCGVQQECTLDADLTLNCDGNSPTATLVLNGLSTYDINLNGSGQDIDGAVAGTYTFTLGNGNNQNIEIQDTEKEDCYTDFEINKDCPDCDLSATSFTECQPDGSYIYHIIITGSGLYNIQVNDFEGNNFSKNNAPAGEYTFTGLTSDTHVAEISQVGNPNGCSVQLQENHDCTVEQSCDLSIMANAVCTSNSQYEIHLTIVGSYNYDVEVENDEVLTNVPAGDYVLGPYNDGEIDITVSAAGAEQLADCVTSMEIAKDCDLNCDLIVSYEPICEGNTNYNMLVHIAGSSVYDILVGGGPPEFNDVPAGDYIVGPFDDDGNFQFVVRLGTGGGNQSCRFEFFGEVDCVVNTSCDMEAVATTTCVDAGDSFTGTLVISGTDTYTIIYNQTDTIKGLSAGTYNFGPYPNGPYSAFVQNETNPVCFSYLSGSVFCEPPPTCDLDVAVAPVCNSDNTAFDLAVTISGSSTYSLFKENVLLKSGIIAGTETIGTYTNNGQYNVKVVDEALSACVQEFSGIYACAVPPPCDISASIDSVVCFEEANSYAVHLTLNGSSTYTINFDGQTVTGVTAATAGWYSYTYNDENSIILQVVDEKNENCQVNLLKTLPCFLPPPCDINVTNKFVCLNDDEYNLEITISGSSTYNIWEGDYPGNLVQQFEENVPAGVYTVGPFNNGEYDMVIMDSENPECNTDYTGTWYCEPSECDLSYTVATECHDDGTYDLIITISGSSEYRLRVRDGGLGGNEVYDEINPAGTYTIKNLTQFLYYVNIADVNFQQGCYFGNEGSMDCTPPGTCNLNATPQIDCLSQDEFNINLNITGPSTYNVQISNSPDLFNQPAGSYVLGPFDLPQDADYQFLVTDVNDPTCFVGSSGFVNCEIDPSCDLLTEVSLLCNEKTAGYAVSITITGSSTYNITTNFGAPLNGVTAGTYPLGNSTLLNYEITVQDVNFAACVNTISGAKDCTEPPFNCDINLSTATDCLGDNTYNVTLTLAGTGTYTVMDQNGSKLANVSAGNLTMGPYPNGSFSITAVSNIDATCTQTITGIKDCTPIPECNLTTNILGITCLDETTYEITLSISGGSTYLIADGQHPDITITGGGEVKLGPFNNGQYSIKVTDTQYTDCFKTLAGIRDCANPIECDLGVQSSATCTGGNEFEVELLITGSAVYNITDGVHPPVFDQTAGTVILPGYVSGDYTLHIADKNNTACAIDIPVSQTCNELPPCDIVVNTVETCLGAGDFQLEIALAGSSTYNITDGVSTILSGVTEGKYILPVMSGQTYFVQIIDIANDGCNLIVSGEVFCDATKSAIGNRVFNDANGNGVQDPTEGGLEGVTVYLYTTDNNLVATTITDVNGFYLFNNLDLGSYYISVGILPSYIISPANAGGNPALDSDIDATGRTPNFTLFAPTTDLDLDAGYMFNSLCEGAQAYLDEVCKNEPDFSYYLGMYIEQGTAPYTISGNVLNTTIAAMGAVPEVGPVAPDIAYQVLILDANNCLMGNFTGQPNCKPVLAIPPAIQLTGDVAELGNNLYWQIADDEGDNISCTLWRMTSGGDVNQFEVLNTQTMKPKAGEQQFAFFDANAVEGANYYRVTVLDSEGKTAESNIIALLRGNGQFDILQVMPQPATDAIAIRYFIPDGMQNNDMQLYAYDVTGRLVFQNQHPDENTQAGIHQTNIDVRHWAAGTYLLTLTNANQTRTVKVVVIE